MTITEKKGIKRDRERERKRKQVIALESKRMSECVNVRAREMLINFQSYTHV